MACVLVGSVDLRRYLLRGSVLPALTQQPQKVVQGCLVALLSPLPEVAVAVVLEQESVEVASSVDVGFTQRCQLVQTSGLREQIHMP